LLYFGLQAKLGKLDAAGKSKNENVTEMLNQVRMMLDHPIWDPDTNKQVLLDHVFVACGGEITKQAKNWLAQKLDTDSRRHLIFMDRDEILNLGIGVNLRLPSEKDANEDVPF
jgi:acyl CoA:acetate/3-ketoacid CoA transferase